MDRFCPNCGTRLEEGAGKCPFCGAASGIGGGNAPKNTKKFLVLGGGIVIALAVVFLLVRMLPGADASPVEEFVRVHTESLTFELPEQVTDFSTDMTLSMGVDNTFLNAYFRQAAIDWKLDVSGQSLNTLLDFVWSGSPLITAQITYEDGQLGLYIPEASGKYYLFDVQEWYEMDGADFSQLEALRQSGLSLEEWKGLYDTYLNIFLEIVTEDTLAVERGKSATLPQLGEKVKADCYTLRLTDEKPVKDMIDKLADTLEQDEELRNAMRVFWEPYYTYVVTYGSFSQEELDEYLDELAEDLRADADEIARQMVEDGFYVQAYIRDGSICYERVAWNQDGGEKAFAFESGKNGGIFYLDDDGDCVVSLEHRKQNKNAGQWILSARDDWDDPMSITVDYEIDPEQKSILQIPYGAYTLSLYSPSYTWENEMAITLTVGPGEEGGSDHTLAMSGEGLMEESGLDDMGITEFFFTLHTTDEPSAITAPSAPTVQVHGEEDLQELADGLEQLAYLLSGQLAGL